MKSLLFALACSLALTNCLSACGELAAAPPAPPVMDVKTVDVKIQTPVPCVKNRPVPPAAVSDRDLLTGSGAQVFDKTWADHIEKGDYIAQLETIVSGCAALPAAAAAGASATSASTKLSGTGF